MEAIGEENLSAILSDFSCSINKEIENFVWHKAIEFAKKKMSITYFLMDTEGEIAAIFTLTHKAVEIGNADISSTLRRKLSRYVQLDGNTNSYTVSAFLIAQFGKRGEVCLPFLDIDLHGFSINSVRVRKLLYLIG